MDTNLLYRFFRGETSRSEDRAVMEWMETDARNARAFELERKHYNALLMMGSRELSPRRASRSLRGMKIFGRVAAAVAICAGVGAWILSLRAREEPSAVNTITVPVGQRMAVTLSDGSRVTVNGSSTLVFPASLGRRSREVELKGEAFFEVAADEKRPFVVHTARSDVKAVGTLFNVEAYDGDDMVVSLLGGRVLLSDKRTPGREEELSPNQRAVLDSAGLAVGVIPARAEFQWRHGLIGFQEASFAHMMRLFEKYYGVRILYDKALFPDITFSGKIRISEGVDHAMWVLKQNAAFDYQKKDDSTVITIKPQSMAKTRI